MHSGSCHFRPLEMTSNLDRVVEFYVDAPDYWEMAEGNPPGIEKAKEFFEDIPPNCNPGKTHRLGFFWGERLSGIADFFYFPEDGDAYIGLMMFGSWARNKGFGEIFLSHLEELACAAKAQKLYTAVMTINTKGRAFWEREGFPTTGLSGMNIAGDHQQELHRLLNPL